MRPLRLRASATAWTGSSGPPFTEPAQRQSAGRSVVTATRPPLTSHVILSPGPTSSASQTSFGTVVCLLLVMVELGICRGSLRILLHVRRRGSALRCFGISDTRLVFVEHGDELAPLQSRASASRITVR